MRQKLLIIIVLGLLLIVLPAGTNAQIEDEEEFVQSSKLLIKDKNQDDPVLLFNKGQDAHSKGDLVSALKLYLRAIEVLPEFPEALYQAAKIFEERGDFAKAEGLYRKALNYRSDWTLPMSALGAALVRKGRFAEAKTLLTKALELNAMSFPAVSALTELYVRTNAPEGDLRELLVRLRNLTAKSKIPASIWASRAALERTLGDPGSARTSVTRALAINRADVTALSENIELLLLERDPKAAVTSAKALVKRSHDSVSAKLLLARAYHLSGEIKEAVRTLESIGEAGEDVAEYLARLRSEAMVDREELEKALKTNPKDAVVLGRLCVISRVAAPEKALDYCRRASELEPEEIRHAVGFGAALVQLKRYASAAGLFRKLLRNEPENFTIRANLATALFQMGRYEEAKSEYLWLTRKDPELTAAYYFLGISFDKLRKYLDAMANYQQFLRLADPVKFRIEIEKVNLRLPVLQRQIKRGKGRK